VEIKIGICITILIMFCNSVLTYETLRVSVSRSLKSFAEQNRPEDWLSARNCALQYNTLLEKAGAHKRKRGERHPSSGSTNTQQGETPGEIILKQLTQGFHLI
jgi:hypothetical protein